MNIAEQSYRPVGLESQIREPRYPLIALETLQAQPGQHFIVDDISTGDNDYSAQIDAIVQEYPNLIPLSTKDLNTDLAYMLTEIIKRGSSKDEQGDEITEPTDVTYICPGGGGRRLRESLNTIGYPTPQYLDIATERPPENKAQAIVSAKSVEDIRTLEKAKARIIIILDDAINGGGTVREIIKTIRENPDLKDATLIVGTQIRFVPKGGDAEYVEGVEGCAVITALSLVSCKDNESTPLTYVSSHEKRDPDEDARLEKMAGGPDKKTTLVMSMKDIKRQRLQKDHLPTTESFQRFISVLSCISDAQTMLKFVGDAFTTEELEHWSKRVAAARLLRDNRSQQDIMTATTLGQDTVNRVNTWRNYGFGGYEEAFSMENEQTNFPDRRAIPEHLQQHLPEDASFDELVSLLSLIRDKDTMIKFVGDSLAHKEMLELGNRVEAAYAKYQEKYIAQAMADTGLTRGTVTRVYQWYETKGFGGYEAAFAALSTQS